MPIVKDKYRGSRKHGLAYAALIERGSVEATIYQHIRVKGGKSRIIKVGSGIYGVRREPSSLDNLDLAVTG